MAGPNKWTAADLRRLTPAADQAYIDALVEGWDALQAAQINTPIRRCHFLAQAMHETGDFTIIREKCTWSASRMCELWPKHFSKKDPIFLARVTAARGDEETLAEMAYGGRADLGNEHDGDGYVYRGGGIFQGTGRSWYRETGQAIGVDLEGNPQQIEDPRISLKAAIWYWKRYQLNRFADRNYIRAIGNQINRGHPFSRYEPIGAAARKKCFDRAWALFGDGALPSPHDLALGAYGDDVEAVQNQLRDLGYAPGRPDCCFGEETARAMAAFKADWKRKTGQTLEADELVGPLTRAALATADPVQRPERAVMSLAELKADGSTEVQHGMNLQKVGTGLFLAGSAGGAANTAPTTFLTDNLGWVPSAHQFLIPVLEGLKWFAANMLWIVPVVGGLWIYLKGGAWLKARLAAARKGLNLSR